MSTQKRDKAEVDAKAGGAAAGGVAGAAIGGAVGGPIGAAIGAVAGAAAGGLTGAAFDYNEAEPEFRNDFENSTYRETTTWDQASPAYRYGWESYNRPEYQGRAYDEVRTDLSKGWTGQGRYEDYEPMIRTAWDRRAQRTLDTGGQAVVPVVEEELAVGKRKVEKGGVRVETRVTETPVQEQVNLREEKVTVERRPVDRPATAEDVAFQEGSLELKETAEEVVASKRPKVVEEVVVGKQATERTETVQDTVRRTDVDVHETPSTPKVVESEVEVKKTAHSKKGKTDIS